MSRTRHEAATWRPAQASGCVQSLSYDYPNGHEVLPHVHHQHQLVYAVQGVMTVSADRGSWVVPAHRGVWMPAHVEHAIRMSGAVSMRTLYLDPRIAHGLPRECRVVDVPPLLREIILRAVEHGSLDRRVPAQRHLVDVLLDEVRALPSRALHVPRPADPARQTPDRVRRARPGSAPSARSPRQEHRCQSAHAPAALSQRDRDDRRELAPAAPSRAVARDAGGRFVGHGGRVRRGLSIGECVRLGLPSDVRRDPRAVLPRSGHARARRAGTGGLAPVLAAVREPEGVGVRIIGRRRFGRRDGRGHR